MADQACCLIEAGRRCTKPGGTMQFTKRHQRLVTSKKAALEVDDKAGHNQLCAYHKDVLAGMGAVRPEKRRKRGSDDADPEVNFGQLNMSTLKRYKRHYELEPNRTLHKQELVDVSIQTHVHA